MRTLTIALILSVLALTKVLSFSHPYSLETRMPQAVGGADTSGGETPRSAQDQVQKAVEKELPHLKIAYQRIKAFYDERAYVQQNREELLNSSKEGENSDLDTAGSEDDFLLKVFESSDLALFDRIFSKTPAGKTVFDEIALMHFRFQNPPCIGEFNDPRDMSVRADGEVCVSFDRLHAIPPQNLSAQILALLSMESSHLMGFQRADAASIRDWFLSHVDIVLPNTDSFHRLQTTMLLLISDIGETMDMASREKFSLGQIDHAVDEMKADLTLIKTMYLRQRLLHLPVTIEHSLYALYYGASSLGYSVEERYFSEKLQGMKTVALQKEFMHEVRKLADQALQSLNQIREFEASGREPIRYPDRVWQDLMYEKAGLQTYSHTVPPTLSNEHIWCDMHTVDGRINQSFRIYHLSPSGGDILDSYEFKALDSAGRAIGSYKIQGRDWQLNDVELNFIPLTNFSEWQVSAKTTDTGRAYQTTETRRGDPVSGGVIGFLIKDRLNAFSAHVELNNRLTGSSQSLDIHCEYR